MQDSQQTKDETSARELIFFGAITASVTHELNNVLSIIDQTAGLLDDLLLGINRGRPITPEKLKSITDNITKQTGRGFDFIRKLNRFAHSVDEPVSEFNLNQAIENIAALVKRFADLKRVELRTDIEDEPIDVVSNSFLLQMVIFLLIKASLETSGSEDSIELSCSMVDSVPTVKLGFTEFPFDNLSNTIDETTIAHINEVGWNIRIEKTDTITEVILVNADS